jgi:tankyrase
MVLARRFPRIANRLEETWRRVARCEDYFDTLVADSRGNRRGFPSEVAQELSKLRGFYAELHPCKQSGWDFAEGN